MPRLAAWRGERLAVAALLAAHVLLACWGIARNSVTFDENEHVPAGAAIVTRGDFLLAPEQAPLARAAYALAALAAGARVPPLEHGPRYNEFDFGQDFAHANADRYVRVFSAARLMGVLFSVLLALLVWRWARRLHGPRGGLLALGTYAFAPEALAHAGVAGIDMPSALTVTASLYCFWRFTREGTWRTWALTALAVSLALLTRFNALQLGAPFLALALLAPLGGGPRSLPRLWIGLALLPLAMLLALQAGYLGHTSWLPLSQWHFGSPTFQHLQQRWPRLRLPAPDAFVAGIDFLGAMRQSQSLTLLLGRVTSETHWYYAPFALLIKWPIGFLALLLARGAFALWVRRQPGWRGARHAWHERFVWLPALALLLLAMFVTHLDVGIRYLLPMVPLLCVWIGALAAPAARFPAALERARRRWALAGAVLAALAAAEALTGEPYPLSFFNRLAGAHADQLVNDSAVDWGQGLVALRDELKRRGIGRVYLAYHGTTDPALYGIDYVPYLGGEFGGESDWFAVSSYYLMGLPQRMVTPQGRTSEFLRFDLWLFRQRPPTARPARCMYLYRLR
jgi:4-amino-4-deoxy-L-arabinose transferase-like glycosyltransferase